jgi:hypothetical protein
MRSMVALAVGRGSSINRREKTIRVSGRSGENSAKGAHLVNRWVRSRLNASSTRTAALLAATVLK